MGKPAKNAARKADRSAERKADHDAARIRRAWMTDMQAVERALVAIDDFLQAQRLPSELAEKAHAVHEAVAPLRAAMES